MTIWFLAQIERWCLRCSRHILTITITLITIVYAVLLFTAVGPLNAFWSSDQGVKLIQTQSLILTKFRSNALVYPGAGIDPQNQFTPFRGQYLTRGHQTYAMFSRAFAAMSAIPFFFLGYPGIYLLPLLSTTGILITTAAIARLHLQPLNVVVLLILCGLCSPFLFYAMNFWEHTPTVFLVSLALLCTTYTTFEIAKPLCCSSRQYRGDLHVFHRTSGGDPPAIL